MASPSATAITEAAYLHLENLAVDRHEFQDGRVRPMPIRDANESLLAASIGSILHRAVLHNTVLPGCRIFSSSLKFETATGTYT